MLPDSEGFLYPVVKRTELCTQCGTCAIVCPDGHPATGSTTPLAAFGGHFSDPAELCASASGGLATAISKKIILDGGAVAGVEYTDSFRDVRFAIADRCDSLEAFRTSKYVQADKGSIYRDVVARLRRRQTVLFVGLPCEVAAMVGYAGKHASSLYTCDLICHGPTSPRVQREFCSKLEAVLGAALVAFSVRFKAEGWKPPYIRAIAGNGREHMERFSDSDYGIAFRFLKRPSCHVCRFKGLARIADLTLGDYHGVSRKATEYNPNGVSVGLVNTPRGFNLLLGLDGVVLAKTNMRAALRNRALHTSIRQRFNRRRFARTFSQKGLRAASDLKTVRYSDGVHAFGYRARTILSRLKRCAQQRIGR